MAGSDDVAYVPSVTGEHDDLGVALDEWLVLGEPGADLLTRAEQLGVPVLLADGAQWAPMLHQGTYSLRDDDRVSLMTVVKGLPPVDRLRTRARFDDRVHVGLVEPVLQSMRPGATHARTSATVAPGDLARLRSTGELVTVQKVRPRAGAFEATIDTSTGVRVIDADSLEVVEGDPRDPSFWVANPAGGADDLALTITWTKLRHALTDVVYSFATSKTVFRPYQFAPVLKLLSSGTGRLLVADEVGLGKTIEAGLIWSELEQRSKMEKVLVVAPASLQLKWKSEMARRFDRDLETMKPKDLLEVAAKMRDGREVRLSAVVSIEALRSATDVLAALTEVHARLDLVIVDEAHALRNRGRRGYEMGQLLADWADVLVFLSATPLNLGQSDLFNLVNMLREEEFSDEAVFAAQLEPNSVLNEVVRRLVHERRRPRRLLALTDKIAGMELGAAVTARPDFAVLRDVLDTDEPLDAEQVARAKRAASALNTLGSVLTRTRKADVPDAKAKREAVPVEVVWTDQERALYEGVRALYTAELEHSRTPAAFGLQMPLRQAASCLPAMQQVLRERHGTTRWEGEDPEVDLGEDLFDGEVEEGPDLGGRLARVPGLLAPLARDSKLEAMREHLRELRDNGLRQVMVFSFFRRTLAYLGHQLSGEFSVRVMTGATSMDERQQIMEDFRAGAFEILLLSQVGAEGLDFEFCGVLVNYDLPWNPMQVEQRIGRLDRFGQKHERIYILNMHVPGTIETDIFERLYTRIGVFEHSIGALEPILRDEMKSLTTKLLDPRLSAKERERETERQAVAMAERAEQIRELQDASGALSTVEQLKVDGMGDDGPTDGRYVGSTEVRRLLERLLAKLGGTLTAPSRTGICRLRGTDALAQAVRATPSQRRGGALTAGQLAADLRDGKDIRVTFDSDVASKHDVELVSSRHPLVATAMRVLGESDLGLRRFGVVGLSAADLPTAGCVAMVVLAESSGLRDQRELWVAAVDDSGRELPDLGPKILEAVASGTLADVEAGARPDLEHHVRRLDDLVANRRAAVQAVRRDDNAALVEARIASRERSLDLKIDKAEATLRDAIANDRSERVLRMHRGRVNNLRTDRDAVRADLDSHKHLDLTTSPVAVLQVHPV